MRTQLPDTTLAWALSAAGASAPARVEPIHGGIASAVDAVLAADGAELIVKRAQPQEIATEASALRLLADGPVPVPRLYAASDDAIVMQRLPGATRHDASCLDADIAAYAAILTALHLLDAPEVSTPFQTWIDVGALGPPPAFEPVVLHRDLHPGNVLFDGDWVSGVIDWAFACRGPAALDVAHCASNLAGLHGPDAALALWALTGEDPAYWGRYELAHFTPDLDDVVDSWRSYGRTDLDGPTVRARLREYEAAISA